MVLTYGFYNSVGSDRTYDAKQMGEILQGVVVDGIFPLVGNKFAVSFVDGTTVNIGTGRAWFNNTWTYNETAYSLGVPASHASLNRFDEVVLEIDTSTRTNTIKVVSGVAASTPVRATLPKTGLVRQYALVTLYRPAGSLLTSNYFTHRIGSAETPYATSGVDNARTTTLPTATSMSDSDYVAIDGTSGPRKINKASLKDSLMGADGSQQKRLAYKRSTYRDNSLGSTISAEQLSNIQDGLFDDLYIGDYWSNGGVNYRIVDMDVFYRIGSPQFNTHHVVVMPDLPMGTSPYYSSNNTDLGYSASLIRGANMNAFKTTINNVFGSTRVKTYRDNLISNVGRLWSDAIVELPSETMLFGTNYAAISNAFQTTHTPLGPSIAKQQFAAFQMNPQLTVSASTSYWLRDIASGGSAACVSTTGSLDFIGASNNIGVRPFFLLG